MSEHNKNRPTIYSANFGRTANGFQGRILTDKEVEEVYGEGTIRQIDKAFGYCRLPIQGKPFEDNTPRDIDGFRIAVFKER